MQHGFSKFWLIFVLLISAVGGVLAWQYFKVPEEGKTPEVKTFKKNIKDDTSSWKIYRNEEYGFELRYPSDWMPHERTLTRGVFWVSFWDKDCSMECGTIEINIKNRNNKPFQEIKQETEKKYSKLFLSKAFPFKETTVGGEKAFIIPGYEFILETVVVVHNEYIYEISRTYSDKDIPKELFHQTLSTFKFLE